MSKMKKVDSTRDAAAGAGDDRPAHRQYAGGRLLCQPGHRHTHAGLQLDRRQGHHHPVGDRHAQVRRRWRRRGSRTRTVSMPVASLYMRCPGTSYFNVETSFAMIRGGRMDVAVLGALQVSAKGDLAGWNNPARGLGKTGNIGGSMDLAVGAREAHRGHGALHPGWRAQDTGRVHLPADGQSVCGRDRYQLCPDRGHAQRALCSKRLSPALPRKTCRR